MKHLIATTLTLGLLSSLQSAHAAFAWAGANVSFTDYAIHGGVQLLPIPFLGTFGVEAALERPFDADRTDYSFGATLRDVRIPLTSVDLFASAGVRLREAGQDPFLEGGFRTDFSDFVNAVGLRGAVRFYGDNSTRIGLGLEVRF